MDLAGREGWQVSALHTEEGQLDEVFRRITLPDTVKK
jgi:ABC-2 type transport system ATP-binding protein